MDSILAGFSLLLSLAACAVALYGARIAHSQPSQRTLLETLENVAVLQETVERMLARSHNAARRENVGKAREAATVARTVKQDAEAILAEAAGELAQPQAQLQLKAPDEAAQLIELRKRAGIH
jgi:hypothetical protein